jgi:hypothetical protein
MAEKAVLLSARPSGTSSLDAGPSLGGASQASSIGNFKGVMLCNRPAALDGGNAAAGTAGGAHGGAHGGGDVPFTVPGLPRAIRSTATTFRARLAAAGALGGGAAGEAALYSGGAVERGREEFSLEGTLRAYSEAAALLS